MPNKTQNYQLNQYQPDDNFLRTDFNEDNAKIDGALTKKAEVIFGTYVGDGTASRIVPLGFTPKAVLLCSREGQMNSGYNSYGGLALTGQPSKFEGRSSVEIVEGGFQVTSLRITSSYSVSTNQTSTVFFYIAFR